MSHCWNKAQQKNEAIPAQKKEKAPLRERQRGL
jgi:hypothetical protein